MKYRSDIDGIRCLAVSSVFLFHLNNKLLPGGFTGVDIFFVISGFLISRIIISDVQSNSFSITRFYARRVRRIFPALFTVLFVTALMAVVAFEPDLYRRFFTEFRFASLQIANFLFVQGKGYFEPSSDYSLLLHTWSLGVEEQFYLIWPFLILVISKFFKQKFLLVLSVITLVSFLYSDYLCTRSAQVAFYMLPSRAWELGVGGIIAIISLHRIPSLKTANILAIVGFLLVLFPMFWLDESSLFPGRHALPSVAGTALLLYAGASFNNNIVSRLLSLKLFTAIGLISYSLYLWHWPLIVFHRITVGQPLSLLSGLAIVTLAVACSTLSYFVIERPFRNRDFLQCYRVLLPYFQSTFSKRNFVVYLVLFIIIPVIATQLVLYSTKVEGNKTVTTVTFEVEVLHCEEQLAKETIVLYWGDEDGNFTEKNSYAIGYTSDLLQSGNRFKFVFKIPELRAVNGIRLDPFQGGGEVKISNLTVAGGLFNIPKKYDVKALTNGDFLDSFHNIHITNSSSGSFTLVSTDNDPHFLLFHGDLENYLEKQILFALFCCCSLMFISGLYCVKIKRSHSAVLITGSIAVLITLLFSTRLNYSSHGVWRFLKPDFLERQFASAALTNIAAIPQSDDPDIVLFGDSHSANYSTTLRDWSNRHHLSLKIIASPACPPIFYNKPEFEGKPILRGNYNSCTNSHNNLYSKALSNPKTKFIFIAFRQEFYFENSWIFFNGQAKSLLDDNTSYTDLIKISLRDTIQTLIDSGKNVILLGQIPILKESPRTCMVRDVTLYSVLSIKKETCNIDRDFSDAKLNEGRKTLSEIAVEYTNVYYFNPAEHISTIYSDTNEILYLDDNHLNDQGSIVLSRLMQNDIDLILKGKDIEAHALTLTNKDRSLE